MHLLKNRKRLRSSSDGPDSSQKGVRRISKSPPKPIKEEIIEKSPKPPKTSLVPLIKKIFTSRKLHVTVGSILFLSLLTTGVYLGYKYLYTSPHFRVKQVEMSPTVHVEREVLLKSSGIRRGINIFKIKLGQVALNLTKHPWIKKASVWRKLPDTLHIKLQEEQAVSVIFFTNTKAQMAPCDPAKEVCKETLTPFYLVNSEGSVFKRATPLELKNHVIITGISRKTFETNPYSTRRKIVKCLNLLDIYKNNLSRPALSEIFIKGDIVTLFLKKTGTAIHFDLRNFSKGVNLFDTFLSGLDLPLMELSEIFMDNRENPNRVVVIPHHKPEQPLLAQEDEKHKNKKEKKHHRKNKKRGKNSKTDGLISKKTPKNQRMGLKTKKRRRSALNLPTNKKKTLLSRHKKKTP